MALGGLCHLWILVPLAGEWGAGHVTGFQIPPTPSSGDLPTAPPRRKRGAGTQRMGPMSIHPVALSLVTVTEQITSNFSGLKLSPFDLLTILWVSSLGWVLLSSSTAGLTWGPPCSRSKPAAQLGLAGLRWAHSLGWCGLLAGPRDSSRLTLGSSHDSYGPKG